EEEDFVLQISDADEIDEEEIVNNEAQEAVELNIARVPKRLATEEQSLFVGKPVDVAEAKRRWPDRYLAETGGAEAQRSISKVEKLQARRHYTQARVDGRISFALGDDAHVMAGDGNDNYICRIVEMFEGVDGEPYVTSQWFYRAKDTVIGNCSDLIDDKRVFLSTIQDDNHLDCLLSKIKILQLPLNADTNSKLATVAVCDYYYDMLYSVSFSTFLKPQQEDTEDGNKSGSTISSETDVCQDEGCNNPKEMKLLDLFSGCGAMSTGLCLGANLSGIKLVTKWAVDLNRYACQSLKFNHPETEVRNEKAEEFLALLKEWQRLCAFFSLIENNGFQQKKSSPENADNNEDDEDETQVDDDEECFEVEKILSICYGLPAGQKELGLYFKIRWKGYGEDEDTWEPEDGLSGAQDKLKEFVTNGFNSKILPLPGDADVICGGPPCQGISGFNRFRNSKNPLEDTKNEQLLVYMNIVEHLRPKFVLMENVVDLLRFSKGFLGRYAVGRLVGMNYQTRLGMMVAGAYGLPQFRMRVFLWGAHYTMNLPQFPLPTHNVVVRGHSPLEFESNAVTYDEGAAAKLQDKLYLGDAISDLPAVGNDEHRDEMPYDADPKTEFQKFIRLGKEEMLGSAPPEFAESGRFLSDHRPLKLNIEDYQRVCHIPVKKGANFRDLKGVKVRSDNKVEWDPDIDRVYLPSGKPLVPDYAMTFVRGTSSKPFGRLWWDETVPTVVTRAEPHNQIIIHPEQNRVLTIRENARLQGFPDYYKLFGPIKERYIQVGNAVAVPVARALGYSLGLAVKGAGSPSEPLYTLPMKFPII
ncbi:DNA (Cytosine-5)-methyltransferase CMT3, partial [Heracleum sosnowskyi]